MNRTDERDEIPRWFYVGLSAIAVVLLVRNLWVWISRASGEVLHEAMGSVFHSLAFLLLVSALMLSPEGKMHRRLVIGALVLLTVSIAYWFIQRVDSICRYNGSLCRTTGPDNERLHLSARFARRR
jgi:hypothetical protein